MLNKIKCASCRTTLLFARIESGVIEMKCPRHVCRKTNRIVGGESISTVIIRTYAPSLKQNNVL